MSHDMQVDVGRLVGSGTWTPDDRALLQRLVLADRLTRLLALGRSLRAEGAVADGDPFDLAWRVLRSLTPSTLHQVIAPPAAGAWLATAEALIGRDTHRRLLNGHAAAHFGRLSELLVPWLDRLPPGTELRFRLRSEPTVLLDPAGSVALRLPLELAGTEVLVTASGTTPSFRCFDGSDLAGVGRVLRAPVIDGIVVDAIGPYRTLGSGDRRFAGPDDDATAEIVALLPRALALIDDGDSSHADARAVITHVFPMTTSGPAVLNHTAKAMFGALATSPPASPALLAEVLVHEAQHSKLHAVEIAARLVEPGDTSRHYSPWRDDPRPASAVLHGALSFVAVAELWAAGGEDARTDAVRRSHQVLAACASLDGSPLTGVGQRIATMTRDRATAVLEQVGPLEEPVISEIAGALDAHRRMWDARRSTPQHTPIEVRLPAPSEGSDLLAMLGVPHGIPRNPPELREIRADPTAGGLGRLSVADPLGYASVLSALQASACLDPLTSAVLAGHTAYIARDFSSALVSYEAAVEQDPEDVDRWVDVAFCLRHLGRAIEASAVLHHLDQLAGPLDGPRSPMPDQIAAVTR